jgi:hypothetical protein
METPTTVPELDESAPVLSTCHVTVEYNTCVDRLTFCSLPSEVTDVIRDRWQQLLVPMLATYYLYELGVSD